MPVLQVLARLKYLLSIYSPSKKESKVAQEVKNQLSDIGIDFFEDKANLAFDGDSGNIIAKLKGRPDMPKTVFNAHLDTVETEDPPKFNVENNVISSANDKPVGLDDKVGVALIIELFARIKKKNLVTGNVSAVFTVAEEIGLLGAKNLKKDAIEDGFIFVMDSHGEPGVIVTSAPSQKSINMVFKGAPAHSGIEPEKGRSAIVAVSGAISKMRLGRIDEETTANVGKIKGGSARNIVPGHVEVEAEARSRDEGKLDGQIRHMLETAENESKRNGCLFEYEVIDEYKSYKWEKTDPVVVMAEKAMKMAGVKPRIISTGGGSDTNTFNSLGLPAIALGCGYFNPHTAKEYLHVSDLDKVLEIMENLVTMAAA